MQSKRTLKQWFTSVTLVGVMAVVTFVPMPIPFLRTFPAPVALMTGCSQTDVTGLLNTVIASGEAVLAVAEPGAPWATSLRNALAALQTADTQWKAGSPVAIIIDALNTVQAVLAVIPVTAVYSPLIGVLVAGIEAVLAALPAPTSSSGLEARRAALRSPYLGAVKLNGRSLAHPTYSGAYKAQWNAKAKALGLQAALLK